MVIPLKKRSLTRVAGTGSVDARSSRASCTASRAAPTPRLHLVGYPQGADTPRGPARSLEVSAQDSPVPFSGLRVFVTPRRPAARATRRCGDRLARLRTAFG